MIAMPYFLTNETWYIKVKTKDGVDYKLTAKAPKEAVNSFKQYKRALKHLEKLDKGFVEDI